MAEKRSVPPAARFCAALTTIWLPTPRSAANRYGKRLCRCFAHRTNLCKSDKKSRLDAVSVWMSEFSDSKGQRFESPRPHQRQHPFGRCLFLFCMRFYGVLRGGIRTARARRLTSRRAKKPLRGFFRARLGESPRPHQKCTFLHYVRTCIFYICLGLLSHRLCYSPITWPSFF